MKRPRILLALPLPPPWSGQERQTECLLSCGLDREFDLYHVNTSLGGTNAARGHFNVARALKAFRVTVHVMAATLRHRIDVVSIPLAKNRWGFLRSAVLIVGGRVAGAKVVARLGGEHFDQFFRSRGPLMRHFIRIVLSRVDALIVRADCLKSQFDGLVPPSRLHRVYLGLDVDAFGRPGGRSRRDDGTVRILFVGHLSRAKGAFDVMRAIPAVLTRCPQARFVFAGEVIGEERDVTHLSADLQSDAECQELLSDPVVRRVSSFVHAKTADELRALYWDADVFVLPSYSEGFPFAVLEAMAAGLPAVVTPAGALAEVLTPGHHALVVAPGDISGLADALASLCENQDRRADLARNSTALVRERFTLLELRRSMTWLYRHVLKAQAASR